MKKLIKESGLREIKALAKRYPKAKIYFHQDLDGVTTALAMKNYLEQHGIKVVDAEIIQYGSKEFAIEKIEDEARGDIMPVLVDFAHGKPSFKIHTDHHDKQTGAEVTPSTYFKPARSNVEILSGEISYGDIFTPQDVEMIKTIDSANFLTHNIKPEDVQNAIFKHEKSESGAKNRFMMGFVVNRLLLAYKNKRISVKSLDGKRNHINTWRINSSISID